MIVKLNAVRHSVVSCGTASRALRTLTPERVAGGSRRCLLFLVLPAGLWDKDEVRQRTWEDVWKFRSTCWGAFL